jgi:hypothetical protein
VSSEIVLMCDGVGDGGTQHLLRRGVCPCHRVLTHWICMGGMTPDLGYPRINSSPVEWSFGKAESAFLLNMPIYDVKFFPFCLTYFYDRLSLAVLVRISFRYPAEHVSST